MFYFQEDFALPKADFFWFF